MTRIFRSFLLLSVLALPTATHAQYDTNDNGAEAAPAARLEVRISQLEEEVRRLRGSLEQSSYQNQQLKIQLDKATSDMDYRLQDLEKRQPAAGAAPAGTLPSTTTDDGGTIPDDIETREPAKPPAPAAPPHFATAREQYNYAYGLLNHAKYAEASSAFSDFVHDHPKDPLIGNGYYWLGETYYVRKDYVNAGDNFRQGYEALPTGPKAADNLLKLAMSLDALKKDREACVVLKQIGLKFGGSASTVKARAEQESNRIGCN